jgi:hypothetical protein
MAHDVQVTCYSGSCYAEEPRQFTLAGRSHVVERVMARGRTPAGPIFWVQTDAGPLVLSYDEHNDRWSATSAADTAIENEQFVD